MALKDQATCDLLKAQVAILGLSKETVINQARLDTFLSATDLIPNMLNYPGENCSR